ncbi:DUF6551 family protein [Sphingorhabdus sp.]|uniref:DUF6551 family protein n=1 Tax=Sphingorhabdus sp. TaxID=1902408 RepID=UPI00333FD9B8
MSRKSESKNSTVAEQHIALLALERTFLDPNVINTSLTYQRRQKPKIIKAIIENFCSAAFGAATIGRRDNGGLWSVDGQQRMTAAIRMGMETIPVIIFESSGAAHEASVFLYLNQNRIRVNAAEIFKAAHKEGHWAMRDILSTLHKHGLDFTLFAKKDVNSWPNIRAVSTVQTIYNLDDGNGHLDDFLAFLCATWPGNTDALQNAVMSGLSYFLYKFGSVIDRQAFIRFLKTNSPNRLISEANMTGAGNRYISVAKVCFKLYNTSRVGKKLTNKQFDDVFNKNN